MDNGRCPEFVQYLIDCLPGPCVFPFHSRLPEQYRPLFFKDKAFAISYTFGFIFLSNYDSDELVIALNALSPEQMGELLSQFFPFRRDLIKIAIKPVLDEDKRKNIEETLIIHATSSHSRPPFFRVWRPWRRFMS